MFKAGPAATAIEAAAATTAWANAVVAAGGTVSTARYGTVLRLIERSMAIGHWALTDDIALLTGENETQALVSLKGRRVMTAANGPTFTIDRGYGFDGVSQYIDTNHDLVAHSRAMTGNDIRLGAYETVNLQSGTTTIGTSVAGVSTVVLRSRSSSTTMLSNLATSVVNLTIAADSRALKVASRSGGGTTIKGWDRGVALTDGTAASAQNVLPPATLFIGARNNGGTPDQLRAATVASAEWGAPLPSTEVELAWYTALQSFMTAVGANV